MRANVDGKFSRLRLLTIALAVVSLTALACAPEPDGAVVFADHCALCHLDPLWPRAPHLDMMEGWTPELIMTTLTTGLMQEQGRLLTAREQRSVADFISVGIVQDAE